MKILIMLLSFILHPFNIHKSKNYTKIDCPLFIRIAYPKEQLPPYDTTKLTEAGLNEYYKIQ